MDKNRIIKYLLVVVPVIIVLAFGISYLSLDNKSTQTSQKIIEINKDLTFIQTILDEQNTEAQTIKQKLAETNIKTDENSVKIDQLSKEIQLLKAEQKQFKTNYSSDHDYIMDLKKVITVTE